MHWDGAVSLDVTSMGNLSWVPFSLCIQPSPGPSCIYGTGVTRDSELLKNKGVHIHIRP